MFYLGPNFDSSLLRLSVDGLGGGENCVFQRMEKVYGLQVVWALFVVLVPSLSNPELGNEAAWGEFEMKGNSGVPA